MNDERRERFARMLQESVRDELEATYQAGTENGLAAGRQHERDQIIALIAEYVYPGEDPRLDGVLLDLARMIRARDEEEKR